MSQKNKQHSVIGCSLVKNCPILINFGMNIPEREFFDLRFIVSKAIVFMMWNWALNYVFVLIF